MLFVDGNNAGVQLGDAFGIDVRANYVMSGFRETRGSHQSHITTPDYANMQSETPLSRMVSAGTGTKQTNYIIAELGGERQAQNVQLLDAEKDRAVATLPCLLTGYEVRLPISSPRRPRRTSCGWRRITFQRRRADSSRLISPSDARMPASKRSTNWE
jgi:hypothetical protein